MSDLAAKRAINMRDEALLWDILARDLKREAKRLDERVERKLPTPRVSENPATDVTKTEKLFVRISDAAKMMGIGRSSLYNEIAAFRIPVRKAGKASLIAVSDIHTWFDAFPKRSASNR